MKPDFIYLSLDPESAVQQHSADFSAVRYTLLEDVLALSSEPMGYAIETASTETARKTISALCAKNNIALTPIFLMTQMPEELVAATDGIATSLNEACLEAQKIHKRIKTLDRAVFSEQDAPLFRMLAFLYSRPRRHLDPVRAWSHPRLYHYPLADAILGQEENSWVWLKNMVERKLLRPGELIDRIRLCPQCSTAHLNYVDTCPNCFGIDILQKSFLHCFTCGSVSPEDEFLEKGYLNCPNCSTRLRHIGADYDRALESYACNQCAHKFEEPGVTAQCMDCSKKTDPENLVPENIHRYEIADQGRISLKTGLMEDVYAILDTLDNLNPAFFESILEWQLKLSQRYQDIVFSLVGIRLLNILALTEKLGRWRVSEIMDGFVARIRELLRSTDLTARTSRRNFWLLLPKTDARGSMIVIERIRQASLDTLQKEGGGIEINTTCFCAPKDVQKGESAALLLARLSGDIE